MTDVVRGALFADRYRILAELGRGGMGIVCRAEDTRLKRPVALKFLSEDLSALPEARAGFLREAPVIAASIAFWYEWNRVAAETSYSRVLALNPCDAITHGDHAWFLLNRRRYDALLARLNLLDVAR